MPGWILLEQNPSSSGSGLYDLRRGGDGVLYCTCRGWLSNKNANRKSRREHLPAECKHTKSWVARTGASYGPMYDPKPWAQPQSQPQPSAKPWSPPAAPQALPPAPKNWRDVLMSEAKAAASRGVVTPAAALAEFEREVRCILVDDAEDAGAVPVPSARALDVE